MREEVTPHTVILSEGPAYLTGTTETEPFLKRLEELSSTDQDVILDLASVQHLNSNGLQVLILAHERLRAQRRRLILCCVDQRIIRIFEITKLSLIFEVRPTRQSALDALSA